MPAEAARPAADDRVVVRIKATDDALVLILCVLFGAIFLWSALVACWKPGFAADARMATQPWLPTWFYGMFGVRGMFVVFFAAGWFCAITAIGAAWRLIDRSPTLAAGVDGLHFHPSVGPVRVAWEDVDRIEVSAWWITYRIEARLRHRFWSTSSCLSSWIVKLPVSQVGLDVQAALHTVQAMNGLRELSGQALEHGAGQRRRRLIQTYVQYAAEAFAVVFIVLCIAVAYTDMARSRKNPAGAASSGLDNSMSAVGKGFKSMQFPSLVDQGAGANSIDLDRSRGR